MRLSLTNCCIYSFLLPLLDFCEKFKEGAGKYQSKCDHRKWSAHRTKRPVGPTVCGRRMTIALWCLARRSQTKTHQIHTLLLIHSFHIYTCAHFSPCHRGFGDGRDRWESRGGNGSFPKNKGVKKKKKGFILNLSCKLIYSDQFRNMSGNPVTATVRKWLHGRSWMGDVWSREDDKHKDRCYTDEI